MWFLFTDYTVSHCFGTWLVQRIEVRVHSTITVTAGVSSTITMDLSKLEHSPVYLSTDHLSTDHHTHLASLLFEMKSTNRELQTQ